MMVIVLKAFLITLRKYHGSEKAECLSKLSKQSLEVVVTTFETFRENTVRADSSTCICMYTYNGDSLIPMLICWCFPFWTKN